LKIVVKRSGGFAGQTEELLSLDTAHLDPEAARRVAERLRAAGYFDLPAVLPAETVGADFSHYEIAVTDDTRDHRVSFDDDDGPRAAQLRSLIQSLSDLR
jgi:Emfourin